MQRSEVSIVPRAVHFISRSSTFYSRHTTSCAEWLRQLIGMTNERMLSGVTTLSGSPATTVGGGTVLDPSPRRHGIP